MKFILLINVKMPQLYFNIYKPDQVSIQEQSDCYVEMSM